MCYLILDHLEEVVNNIFRDIVLVLNIAIIEESILLFLFIV